jgi:hypothetical protein
VSDPGACAVCGRTFLVGEQARSFVSAEGRHEVCELCAGRTAELGWLPAGEDGAEERLRADAERKPGFLAKLFARPEREDAPAPSGRVGDELFDDAPAPAASHDLDTERYDVEAEWAEEPKPRRRFRAPRGRPADLPAPEASGPPPASEALPDLAAPSQPAKPDPVSKSQPNADAAPPGSASKPAPLPDPAAAPVRPRRLQPDLGGDVSPATRFERAIVRFNASDAGRTTAGLTRTLGAPSVSVGDLAGSGDEVRITVAWELTWYQWGVDLGDELRPVYELAKGYEVAEIDSAARQWNASAHDGRVVMVAPRRREAADGRPVHR